MSLFSILNLLLIFFSSHSNASFLSIVALALFPFNLLDSHIMADKGRGDHFLPILDSKISLSYNPEIKLYQVMRLGWGGEMIA